MTKRAATARLKPRKSEVVSWCLKVLSRPPDLNEANWVAVTQERDGSVSFVFRPYGTPGMRIFMWVFTLAWTGFLVLTVVERVWIFTAFFALVELVIVPMVLWMTFGITRLTLAANELLWERVLWNFARVKRIERKSMRTVQQVDDRAEQTEPDSFPSFSLKVEAGSDHWILCRQDADRSDYLGSEIAQWGGVRYVRASAKRT